MIEQVTETVPRALYLRSPFQVAFLCFATLGIYVLWWSYNARRALSELLGEEDQPLLYTLGLIIPILNLFLLVNLFGKIQSLSQRATQPVSGVFQLLGAVPFIFVVLGKLLPIPWVMVVLLFFVPFALGQVYLCRAQVAIAGEAASPRNFNWFEIVVLIIGSLFQLLITIGAMLAPGDDNFDLNGAPWFSWLMLLLSAALLIVFRRTAISARSTLP
jgi:hypothetical protein